MKKKISVLLFLIFIFIVGFTYAAKDDKLIMVTVSYNGETYAIYKDNVGGNVESTFKSTKFIADEYGIIMVDVGVKGGTLSGIEYSWNGGQKYLYKATQIRVIKPTGDNASVLDIYVYTSVGNFERHITIYPPENAKEEQNIFSDVDFDKYDSIFIGEINGYGAENEAKFAREIQLGDYWYNLEQNENAQLNKSDIGSIILYEKVVNDNFNGIRIIKKGKANGLIINSIQSEELEIQQNPIGQDLLANSSKPGVTKEAYVEAVLTSSKGGQCNVSSNKTATKSDINIERGDIVTIDIKNVGEQVDKIDLSAANFHYKYSISEFPIRLIVGGREDDTEFDIAFRYIDKNGNYIINSDNEIVYDVLLNIEI